MDDILEGISESVLNQLVNTEVSVDESMKIRLLDYYQITKLVGEQIKAFIKQGEFAELQLENIVQFDKRKNINP